MSDNRPLISISSWVSKSYEDVFRFAKKTGFESVEFDCDEKPIPATRSGRTRFKDTIDRYGLKVFFHAPFMDQAIGSINSAIRQNTLNTMTMYFDFLEELEANYLVVHAGVDNEECPENNVIDDLRRLAELAQRRAVTLCVENLRFGLSSDPFSLKDIAEATGCRLTFDLGHACSSRWALDRKSSPTDFLRIVDQYVVSAHVYLKEEGGRHHPFTKIEEVEETFDFMRNLNAIKWWTIELPSLEDTIREKLVIDSYFQKELRTNQK